MDELKEEQKRKNSLDQSEKIIVLNKQLDEKDHKLRRLLSERHKHLEEVYEMKWVIEIQLKVYSALDNVWNEVSYWDSVKSVQCLRQSMKWSE